VAVNQSRRPGCGREQPGSGGIAARMAATGWKLVSHNFLGRAEIAPETRPGAPLICCRGSVARRTDVFAARTRASWCDVNCSASRRPSTCRQARWPREQRVLFSSPGDLVRGRSKGLLLAFGQLPAKLKPRVQRPPAWQRVEPGYPLSRERDAGRRRGSSPPGPKPVQLARSWHSLAGGLHGGTRTP
jgi:hypothetical protein